MGKPDPYLIESAAKTLDVLEMFRAREEVRLTDVIRQLGLVKSTAFRALYTLEKKGYIERTPGGRSYRRRRRRRVGMLSISPSIRFVAEVESGIEAEAAGAGMELLLRHHEFSRERAVGGAEELLEAGIELLICYNPDEHGSHVVADRCARRGVPVLAITFPVPGARLFGINNYRAGLAGGEGLGEEVSRRWGGTVDVVAVLDIPGSSPAQQARITGMIEGLRRRVEAPAGCVSHLHIDREQVTARELMRAVLERRPAARRMAVLCYNDANALGAIEAVEEAGRAADVLILSQGGIAEVRAELRRPGSAIWGAVAHFPERFGRMVIPMAARILREEAVPQVVYTEHVLLTRENVGRHYRDAEPEREAREAHPPRV